MGAAVTLKELDKYKSAAKAAMTRAKNAKEEAIEATERAKEEVAEATMTVVQSLEVGATAFAFGVMNGRKGGAEVAGVAADLAAAVALHSIGLFTGGDAAEHFHNCGDGALASYATIQGIGIGKKWAEDARKAQLAPTNPPA